MQDFETFLAEKLVHTGQTIFASKNKYDSSYSTELTRNHTVSVAVIITAVYKTDSEWDGAEHLGHPTISIDCIREDNGVAIKNLIWEVIS